MQTGEAFSNDAFECEKALAHTREIPRERLKRRAREGLVRVVIFVRHKSIVFERDAVLDVRKHLRADARVHEDPYHHQSHDAQNARHRQHERARENL